MSQTEARILTEFNEIVEELENIPPEEARKQVAAMIEGCRDKKFIKGRDIAAAVINPLVSLGAKPERAPIFRLDGRRLQGFLHEFKVEDVDSLQESVPVHVSGTVVDLSYPNHDQLDRVELDVLGILNPDEQLVRIQFIPQDI